MTNHSQSFLDQLATFPPDSFENRFLLVVRRLDLAIALGRNELTLLFEAAYHATLCNIAFNGLSNPNREIQPAKEQERTRLEFEFMVARDVLFASPGWQALLRADQLALSRIFLTVAVAPEKLAA
jgi:hypothetical protein